MIRVLVERDGSLREGEAHHLHVRRVEPGEVVELRDGEGLIGSGTLLQAGKAWPRYSANPDGAMDVTQTVIGGSIPLAVCLVDTGSPE